ncbi:MAG: SpoIVB peptidase [Clostridia bacterium]|nr:SpoIVB peptidase [Clostridia bacterium]
MRVLFRCVWCALVCACVLIFAVVGYMRQALPDSYTVGRGQTVQVGEWVQSRTAAARDGDAYRTCLTLGGLFAVKEVSVTVTQDRVVMVCGTPFGIKLYTKGVLVVGLSDVDTAAGKVNPAAAAGVCVGDSILAINGQPVETSAEVGTFIRACEGKKVTLRLERDGVAFDAAFTPVRAVGEEGYRAGLWVRDSAAGIGTLTFYDPADGTFGGLGHAVCDVDTGAPMLLSGGEIVPARIFSLTKGQAGKPGALKGCFESGSLGVLQQNGDSGLYGSLTAYPMGWQTMAVAPRQQVREGTAQIVCTVNGTRPQVYDAVIEQVRYGGVGTTRNMVIRVTDPALLETTGGIVQGMSGSPIIQDGKLVGAVTHVLVDDPTRGYGIFAENMLDTADKVEETSSAA